MLNRIGCSEMSDFTAKSQQGKTTTPSNISDTRGEDRKCHVKHHRITSRHTTIDQATAQELVQQHGNVPPSEVHKANRLRGKLVSVIKLGTGALKIEKQRRLEQG